MPEQSADRDRSRGALIAVLFLTLSLHAQDPASVALLVTETELAPLAPALQSADALTRATAARVALVRAAETLVPQLREALGKEKDASAARELMRAVVMLGSDEDVAFAASQLPRFAASIDGDFAEAVGRTGAPRATALYLKHVAGSRSPFPAIALALWGRTAQINGTASRLLGAGDESAFGVVLIAAMKGRVPLESGVLEAALGSPSAEIAADTIWYLMETHAGEPQTLPQALRSAATTSREGDTIEVAFGREVLRRMLGADFVEQKQALAWLRSKEGRLRVPKGKTVLRFLTLGEQTAVDAPTEPSLPPAPRSGTHQSITISEPDFRLPIVLPPGLGEAILKKTNCRGGWIGVPKITVDRAGRVQALDLDKVNPSPECRRALETMLRLSLAMPERISAPLESGNMLVVKPAKRAGCFDEDAPREAISGELLRVGGDVKAPKVTKRVEPYFPESVRQEMQGGSVLVMAEAIITRAGCVRDVRLLRQSQWPQLNAAAVLALSEWQFKPATLDGVPVDVLFNLTINFKLN